MFRISTAHFPIRAATVGERSRFLPDTPRFAQHGAVRIDTRKSELESGGAAWPGPGAAGPPCRCERASVLVLVMTILGILFVLGVAFLASMNFEADMIASESQRERAELRVSAAVDDLGSTLRDGLMSEAGFPFGNSSLALSSTTYAEMPGVQGSFSSVEPHWHPGPDGVLGGSGAADDLLILPGYADLAGLRRSPYTGPSLRQGFAIDTSLPNDGMVTNLPTGESITKCLGGVNKGDDCDIAIPGVCPGSVCEGPRVLDADGDGIVDSLRFDVRDLGFSEAQISALSARLNPPSNPTGRVFLAMRVLPHGGLVNLNAAHPKLIENVLDGPPLYPPGVPVDPTVYGNFHHRPTQNQVAYSPLQEERLLRRRGLLPPRVMPPSWLHGSPFLNPASFSSGKADMQWQLFHPPYAGAGAAGVFETVFEGKHRYWAFGNSWDATDPGSEFYNPALPDLGTLWAVRMEPFTADAADGAVDGFMPEYDRRHLVTTISHDDLLARGGTVRNPAHPRGEEDILAKMTQANRAEYNLDLCERHLLSGDVTFRFEYPEYPRTIIDDCCPMALGCKLNSRKGRLKLSLPYLDDEIDLAKGIANPADRQAAFDRIFRLIHDVFFLLVRNATRVTTLEGTPCDPRVVPNPDCVYANGVCGNNGKCTTLPLAPLPPTPIPEFPGCALAACSIPGSVCRADGVCTIQAPYWQEDRPCGGACDDLAGEICDSALDRCVDVWTGQTRSQARISRTAAALTANMIDYADADDVPTRISLRMLDLDPGMCSSGPNIGRTCEMNSDCGTVGRCYPPKGMCAKGNLTSIGRTCGSDNDCAGGGPNACRPPYAAPQPAAGREFDFNAAPGVFQPQYVYGLERQPYITEVSTYAEPPASPPGPGTIVARAVELFNPYDTSIDPMDPNTKYVLIEVDPAGVRNEITLDGILEPNTGATSKPFSVFVSPSPLTPTMRIGLFNPFPPPSGNVYDFPLGNSLTFGPDWTIYLIRRVTFPGDLAPTDIVVDQFKVKGGNIADPSVCTTPTGDCTQSLERSVKLAEPWTAVVPIPDPKPGSTSLGVEDPNHPADKTIHPVEVNFANLGTFSRPFNGPGDPRHGSVAFPTTGSLLMLMRHANRSMQDYTAPSGYTVKKLAFTTRLVESTTVAAPATTVTAEKQIDNGRMPVFDEPQLDATTNIWYTAHHLPSSVTQAGEPGNLDNLPWGQLVFDYFTALPLSNPGPYFVGPASAPALPDALPRVDLDGLRVEGRININAAPWKVLAGLPFVPMEKIPVAFKGKIRKKLGFVLPTAVDPLNPTPAELLVADTDTDWIGEKLAQAIVAYRDLRPIQGSGDYATGEPRPTGALGVAYARGWNPTVPGTPPVPVPLMSRRGTGFMSVGELANVRHIGITDPLYRFDSAVIDTPPDNNNQQNFVDAVAALVALGDWVTVRSQVFTVYGVLRGEEDTTIVDANPVVQHRLRARDADSRALRFQETIDRLPTFLGEPLPRRIGDRTLTRYTDVQND